MVVVGGALPAGPAAARRRVTSGCQRGRAVAPVGLPRQRRRRGAMPHHGRWRCPTAGGTFALPPRTCAVQVDGPSARPHRVGQQGLLLPGPLQLQRHDDAAGQPLLRRHPPGRAGRGGRERAGRWGGGGAQRTIAPHGTGRRCDGGGAFCFRPCCEKCQRCCTQNRPEFKLSAPAGVTDRLVGAAVEVWASSFTSGLSLSCRAPQAEPTRLLCIWPRRLTRW